MQKHLPDLTNKNKSNRRITFSRIIILLICFMINIMIIMVILIFFKVISVSG